MDQDTTQARTDESPVADTTDSPARGIHHVHLTPGSNCVELTLQCTVPRLYDILYCPEHRALVALDTNDAELIEEETGRYNALVTALQDAQHQKEEAHRHNRNIRQAEQAVTTAKAEMEQELERLVKGSSSHNTRWYELHSLHDSQKAYFVPGDLLDRDDNRRFFSLEPDAEDGNALESFRRDNGEIDPARFGDAFKQASADIKAEWKLVDDSGQVASQTLVGLVDPILADLLEDELDALDATIADWNEALRWQSRQYQAEREEAVTLLEDDDFTHEDFGRVRAMCDSVWGADSPINGVEYDALEGDDNRAARSRLAGIVRDKTLPPAVWNANAEANLMRYTRGVTLGMKADLAKGVLSGEAKAEFEFALAEAQLKGAVYYPHDQGYHVRPRLNTKVTRTEWRVFDRCLPKATHFDHDSEFMALADVGEVVEAFGHWDLLKSTVDNRFQLMILGHTDGVGPDDYNQALSLRRAQVVYGLLTRNPDPWVRMFERGHWGEAERNYMTENSDAIHGDSPAEVVRLYFNACEQRFHLSRLNRSLLPRLTEQAFALNYLIPRGELDPVVDTDASERRNRRVEFVLLELAGETEEEGLQRLELGHLRVKLEGHVGGFAGVNLGLAAQVNVSVNQGGLVLANKADVDSQANDASRAGGDVSAEAFIGARVEAGLAAALDWKEPPRETADPSAEPPDFASLGTLGYIVSAQLGGGFKGQFKIGFDEDTFRFVVKVKASLCIGVGAGGKFEFMVDARQVWSFFKLVHEQLLTADFSWLDLFEDKVYDRLVNWSYELMKRGLWFQGVQLRSGTMIANQAVQVLSDIDRLTTSLSAYEDQSEALHDLIDDLGSVEYAVQAKYAPPEVKGRILYRLMDQSRHVWRDWSFTWTGVDVDRPRERAIRNLLVQGVSTRREFLEVLEHTFGASKSGRSVGERCLDASNALGSLLKYMNDAEDREALRDWWARLPDPSGCACSDIALGTNPF